MWCGVCVREGGGTPFEGGRGGIRFGREYFFDNEYQYSAQG